MASSLKKLVFRHGLSCPSCGSGKSIIVSRKYWVTALRRCKDCGLLFRCPTTDETVLSDFYQMDYSQGFTTEMPSPDELEQLKSAHFRGGEKDYSGYLAVLKALGCKAGGRLFDYGCSWGYGSWQMARAGYKVSAFEISQPRREYATRQLGVVAHSSMADVRGKFDVFFSAHVIEHVPSVSGMIRAAKRLLKPDGWFVAFSPNGSDEFKKKDYRSWDLLWGMVHPNFLDKIFYQKFFSRRSYLLASNPYGLTAIRKWSASRKSPHILNLEGPELMVAVKMGDFK